MDILEAPTAQAHRNDLTTGTVHRGINDIEVFLTKDRVLVDHDVFDCHHIIIVHLAADDLNEIRVSLPFDILHAHFVHLFDDTLIMRLEHLATILPVCFISVILLRVVGSGNVHTTLTFEVTDSERNLRRRAKRLKQIHLDAVGGEDVCHRLSEQTTVVTAVVTYDHSYATVLNVLKTAFFLHFQHVVGITLGSLSHDVLVHTVRADTHDTTQTTGTKLEGTIESVDEFCLVLCVHQGFHLCTCLCIKWLASPNLSDFHYFF